jgi:DMSO/TMAO reductase YedYZ molybdopterin-dependent catalytic subunit
VYVTDWIDAPAILIMISSGGRSTMPRRCFRSALEGYSSSIDMATALHPQTQTTVSFDGQSLPARVSVRP